MTMNRHERRRAKGKHMTTPMTVGYDMDRGCWAWGCACEECKAGEQQQCYGPFETEQEAWRDLEQTLKAITFEEITVERYKPGEGCYIVQALIAFRIRARDLKLLRHGGTEDEKLN
jgi:hypothetical protein